MAENKQDMLLRAYEMLSSLRKNIGEMTDYMVPETYVREFHTVLERMESIGIDVSEFHVPDLLVKPRIRASWMEGNTPKHDYYEEKYVDKPYILTKLDAILGYFKIITSEKPRKIGFNK